MLNFDPTTTVQSSLHPDIQYTVRVLNSVERAKRDAKILPIRARIGELLRLVESLATGQFDESKESYHDYVKRQPAEWLAADAELTGINEKDLIPNEIMAGFVSASGFTIGGQPVTRENILSAPTPVLAELYVACNDAAGLDKAMLKNLPSSSTSVVVEDGQIGTTTAPIANATSSTSDATAGKLTVA